MRLALTLMVAVAAAAGCGVHPVASDLEITGVRLGNTIMSQNRLELDDTVMIVAHRGYACCFPENTLPAIAGAWEVGADAIEIDVSMTADGAAVLMHDLTVDRTTNGSGTVRSLTAEEIRALDACTWFGRGWRRCKVPYLREALAGIQGKGKVVLDIKGRLSEAEMTQVLDLVREAGLVENTLLISFDFNNVRLARRLDSKIRVSHIAPDSMSLRALAEMGNAFVVFNKDTLFSRPYLMDAARRWNLEVGAYTTTSLSEARELIRMGVRILLTDIPFGRPEPKDRSPAGVPGPDNAVLGQWVRLEAREGEDPLN
jgi:glycerophosphoryl diester phosphodiesterase